MFQFIDAGVRGGTLTTQSAFSLCGSGWEWWHCVSQPLHLSLTLGQTRFQIGDLLFVEVSYLRQSLNVDCVCVCCV